MCPGLHGDGCGLFARDTGRDFAGRVAVAGIVHEECFEGIASRAVSRDLKPDLVVIGEASELEAEDRTERAGRRSCWRPMEFPPTPPIREGGSTRRMQCRAVERIHAMAPSVHEFLGKGILELTDIKSALSGQIRSSGILQRDL